MEWQPIETAPQGEFMVYGISGFNIVSGDLTMTSGDGETVFFNGDVFVGATHWMPLPEPPKAEGE